jgi:hypothetical protein
VNWEHLSAFCWLKWRLRMNQWRRAGLASEILRGALTGAALLLAVSLGIGGFLLGRDREPWQLPAVTLFVWDGLLVAFVFFWLIGVMTELQRAEALPLRKFLHLPVSVAGAFVLDYLGTWVCFTTIVLLPPMIGLGIGRAVAVGPSQLLLIPLAMAFVLMISALSYQFQGWLASLMANKRRQRIIIVLVPMTMALMAQVPNLIVQFSLNGKHHTVLEEKFAALHEQYQAAQAAHEKAMSEFRAKRITVEQLNEANRQLSLAAERYEEQSKPLRLPTAGDATPDEQKLARLTRIAELVNVALPPGWLALGAVKLADGRPALALLPLVGMTLIGVVSLRRSYRTTVRIYTGQYTASSARPSLPPTAAAVKPVRARDPSQRLLVERQVPWLPEVASAVAVSSLRSMLRAPEAKMLLLSPVMMLVIFAPLLLRGKMPASIESWKLLGAMAFQLLMLSNFVGNQFGFDRSGFQTLVLSGAPRDEMLLGKNLAIAPLAALLGVLTLLGAEVLFPLGFDDLLAIVPQWLTMFLAFCMTANLLSIAAPVRIPAGSLKAAKPSLAAIALHMVFGFLVFPLSMSPVLLPLALRWLLADNGWYSGAPVVALASLAECLLAAFIYRRVLKWQGRLLLGAERRILDTVRVKAEG